MGWNSFCQSKNNWSDNHTPPCATTIDTLLKTEDYTFVDEMPEIEGGMQRLMSCVANNCKPRGKKTSALLL